MTIAKKNGRRGLTHPVPAVIIIVLAFFVVGVALRAFTTPFEVEKEVTTQALRQEVAVDHSAVPVACTLYPSPTPLNNQTQYFVRVLSSFSVSPSVTITADPAAPITGTAKVILKLKAGDLWERDYLLAPEKAFSGSGEVTVLGQALTVPVESILAFTKQVEEETQVQPSGGYTLAVIPVVNAEVVSTGEILKNEFAPEFLLTLTQRDIKPEGEFRQEQSTTLTSTSTVPGSVNVMGFEFPVKTARYVFGPIAVLYLGLLAWMVVLLRRNRRTVSELELINRRYRSRLVHASDGTPLPEGTLVILSSFKEIIKLADERDKSIIAIHGADGGRRSCHYCLPDGDSVYCYKALDELPLSVKMRAVQTPRRQPEETAVPTEES